jgi:hypothetical protein
MAGPIAPPSTKNDTANTMKDNRYKLGLFLIALLASPLVAQAQHGTEFGIDLGVALPQGAFGQNVGQAGFGINVRVGQHLGNSPVLFGVDAGIHVYGHERRREALSLTIPDISASVQTTNNIAEVHGVLRLQPIDGPARPYVEALYGFKYLYTRTSLQDDYYDEEVIGSTNFDDFTRSYGVGAGFDIQVFNGPMGESDRPGAVYLNFGIRYLLSGPADYLREGDIERRLGSVSFTSTRSTVDLVQPRFGVTFAF